MVAGSINNPESLRRDARRFIKTRADRSKHPRGPDGRRMGNLTERKYKNWKGAETKEQE
ncbi:MAG: hypothetical protein WC880_02030 [Candidatus Paceibacterota bacterium]